MFITDEFDNFALIIDIGMIPYCAGSWKLAEFDGSRYACIFAWFYADEIVSGKIGVYGEKVWVFAAGDHGRFDYK